MALLYQVERTRIADRIFLRYELRTVELLHGVKKFDLDNDPDVQAARNANLARRQNM